MRPINSLPEDDLRILFILADKKGHPSWEINEIMEQEKKSRIEKERLSESLVLLYDKKSYKILGKEAEPKKRKGRIDKGNLSRKLTLLETEGWIRTEKRHKTRGLKGRGPNYEVAHYITEETYLSLDRMLLHNLKTASAKFNLAFLRGEYKQEILKGVDGSTFISEGVMVNVDEDTRANREKCLTRFYQWNRSKNPDMFNKYISAAIDSAEYEEGPDRPCHAHIPMIPEVSAGGVDRESCREMLKSNLEERIAIELSNGLQIPPINGNAIETISS
jgi:predicted RNase H-like HicB family nuclease